MKHILNRVISIFTLLFLANWCHAEGTWILVTDASTLQAGDKVIIVARDYDRAMGTTQNTNNRNAIEITKNTANNTCTITDNVQQLTLQQGKSTGTFAFYTGNGYLYAASSSDNYLRTESTLSNNSSWKVSIASDGTATIVAQGTYTNNHIRYNQDSHLFSSYPSSSTGTRMTCIYKYADVELTPTTLTFSDAGVAESVDVFVNNSYVLPARGSSVSGLEFVGWSRTPIVAGAPIASGSILSPGSSVKVEENMTFYAVYAKAVYSGEPAYVKVEGNQTDWSGTYLIACEGMGKVFNGSLGKESLFAMDKSNAVGAEISENKIAWNEETELYEFRVERYDDGYSIKSKSGYYIGCKTTSENIAQLAEYLNKITFDNSLLNIKSSGYWLFYNKSTSRFLYTGSTHERVQLYKRTDVTKSYAFYTTSISIDVPINKYGYATWYAGMPVKVPAGLNAFTCQVEGNTAMLHAVGTVIPAHTGVVLYAAEAVGKGQNVVLSYANVDTTPIASNALIGFVEDTKVDNGKAHYALNVKNNVVGFYIPQTTTDPVLSATSAFTAIAGKAYLELDAQMSISALELKRIDDVSVNQISTSSIDIIYDLMGRKVSSPSKGIYVVNGRKMVLTGEEYKTK